MRPSIEPNSPNIRAPDFRDEAVALSLRAVAGAPSLDIGREDLTRLGISLCLPATGDPAAFRRRYGRVIWGTTIVVIGGWIGAASLLAKSRGDSEHLAVLGGAIACFVVAMVSGLSALQVRNLMFARYAARVRLPRPEPISEVQEFGVSLEEPATIRQMKAVTQDIGRLYLDGARHIATIEGFSHRYVILAKDLRRCVFQRSGSITHFLVTFSIAGTEQTLAIAISYNTVARELKRQLGAQHRPPLAGSWEQAMGVSIEPVVETAPPLPRH